MEKWKKIRGWPYHVSTSGRVKSLHNPGLIMKLNTYLPYLTVMLKDNGRKQRHYVHRLVAITFLKRKNKKLCVNHKDKNRRNNKVTNLEWVTTQQNVFHSSGGELHYCARLTKKDIQSIMLHLMCGYPGAYIAKTHNVPSSLVSAVKLGKTWKHLTKGFSNELARFNKRKRKNIRAN